ncbi:lysosomal proton-coupled steroid conjugate and bile acid symporter SLC46A3 [Alosa pseudoharengus]|uniref:lysosomal proton-coupled steroid conjugate and bile acid symporter SLC46A3 n=1 Tax=Alosa pseudoharengus TaxID=34774 RepID=UPI003F893FEF
MGRVYLIEPVVSVYSFGMFMTYPLVQQYVYRRQWERIIGSPYPTELNNTSRCGGANLSNQSTQHGAVQRETSLFLLHSELSFLFPSLVMSLLLLAYSDFHGRKVAIVPPLLGDILFTLAYATVSRYSLDLGYLLGAAFVRGLSGGPSPLFGACFAYVADRCDGGEAEGKSGRRTARMALLEMLLGMQSGLASIATGFYLRLAGFTWPFLTVTALHILVLAFVLFVLRESLVPAQPAPFTSSQVRRWPLGTVASRLRGVGRLFSAGPKRRGPLLALALCAFAFYNVVTLGGMSLFILYELNAPLCWDEVMVGYGAALSSAMYLGSFAGVRLLSGYLADVCVVLLGLVSLAVGFVMAAFAKTTLLMYLVRVPLLLSVMPSPLIRSMMSKMVTNSEQGAVFACVAFMEMVSVGVSFPTFSSLYAATVSWFPGFSFLLAAVITLVPVTFICAVRHLERAIPEDTNQLIPDDPEESLSFPQQEVRS